MTTILTSAPTTVTPAGAGPPYPTNPALLRLGAVSTVVGFALQVPLSFWHPHQVQPNRSAAAFHEYAHSTAWVLVHLGQFGGALLVVLGLVALAMSLASERGLGGALAVAGGATAVVTAAVFAVQMAVDGVALKAAVDAWEATGRDTSFQVADAVRATEKGLSALFHLCNGFTLVCLGLAVAVGRRHARWLGWVGVATGGSVLVMGVVTALTGFSEDAATVALPATALMAVFLTGTSVSMWRAAGRT